MPIFFFSLMPFWYASHCALHQRECSGTILSQLEGGLVESASEIPEADPMVLWIMDPQQIQQEGV